MPTGTLLTVERSPSGLCDSAGPNSKVGLTGLRTVGLVTPVDDAEALRLEGRWDEALALLEGELARDTGVDARGPILVELARTLNDRSTFGGAPDEARTEVVLIQLETLAREEEDDALLAASLDLRGRALHARYEVERELES
jgi:hypothetical protein